MSTDQLVPDDFDLAKARAAPSATPKDERPKCPECDSVNIATRPGIQPQRHKHDEDWWCENCLERFDEPT